MTGRRGFLAGLAASGLGGFAGLSAAGQQAPAPPRAAAPVAAPVHWWIDARQPQALQALRRLQRAGETVHTLPPGIDLASSRGLLAQARAAGATVAVLARQEHAFVLGELARDAGWRACGDTGAPLAGGALFACRFEPGAGASHGKIA